MAHESGAWAWHVRGMYVLSVQISERKISTGLGRWFRIPFVNRLLLLYCYSVLTETQSLAN